ncbi:MAG: hypothetical protein E7294_07685 [Lachnospiraceae bacterium]|jgi:lipoprotein-anchoring transpeptidase ErfK/SrfK|nr:hypothetical protein [Lachnospiraceae bacterium]
MKKFLASLCIIFVVIPAVLIGGGYFLLEKRYDGTYMFGTYINDVYAEDITPEQMNEKLLGFLEERTIMISTREGEIELPLSRIDFAYSYEEELKKIQKQSGTAQWAQRMLERGGEFTDYHVEPVGSYDREALKTFMKEHKELTDRSGQTDIRVEIQKTADGYELRDDTLLILDGEKAAAAIDAAIMDGRDRVDLEKEGCYIPKRYTSAMKKVLWEWEDVNRLQQSQITYVFGSNEEVVDASVLSDWIALDEDGNFFYNEDGILTYDKEKVKAFVESLAKKYDTTDKVRRFRATSGREVTIKNSSYGNAIDQKAEVEYLMDTAPRGVSEVHIPEYSQRAFAEGDDDIGDTYIEVDMSIQTLYYYQNGRMILQTPVVTGNTRLGRGTPEKVCYVYYKQRHRTLIGPDYRTPVSYWMAVNGNIGIHDASWRGKFGGTIYKTNGSHGCINTPTKAVSVLYDLVEIGTPVIIFY